MCGSSRWAGRRRDTWKPSPGVIKSIVAPWGNSPGMGTQYQLPMTIEELMLDDNFDSGTPNGQDGSFCFSDEHGNHYCVVERGQLRVNVTTQSLSEITYQVLSSDIFWMAVEFESIHRIKGRDFRGLLFQKEMQYWSVLGESLAERAAQKIAETLQKAPYQD